MTRNRAPVALFLMIAISAGCAREAPPPSGPAVHPTAAPPVVRTGPPDAAQAARLVLLPHGTPLPGTASETSLPVLRVEVVSTNADRHKGLGGRTELPPDDGMLFVYPAARPRTFWMKDCALGLDIAFLDDDGRIVHVATLGPGLGLADEAVPRTICPLPARYVLETNAGRLSEMGVGTGDRVDLGAPTAGVVAE